MELWHEATGEGPPVLLIHAGICDGEMWEPQWRSFPGAHRTIRCDLRGFGRTPIPPGTFSHAADVAELLDRLEPGPVAVIGASFGGVVALDLALARPDLVSQLVLAGAALAGHEWSERVRRFGEREDAALAAGDIDGAVEANLRMWVDGPHREPDEVDPQLRRRVGEMQRRAFELQLPVREQADDELWVDGPAERLGTVAVPTLVVVGALDVTDIHRIADRLTAGIDGAQRAEIAAAAHLPSAERPREFDRLVLGFLGD